MPVDPLRRDREAEARAADAGERAADERVRRSGSAVTLIPIASAAAGDSPTARTLSPGRVRAR